jgi:hypothetical protein
MIIQRSIVAAAACAITTISAPAEGVYIRHEIEFMLTRSGGYQSTVRFVDGASGIDVPLSTQDDVTVPHYELTAGISAVNRDYGSPARTGSPMDFQTISSVYINVFAVFPEPSEEPVMRNLLSFAIVLTTDLGEYSNLPNYGANFVSYGPRDFVSEPIISKYMAHDGLVLYLNGDPDNAEDVWHLREESTITSITIPTPPPATLLTIVCMVATGYRRRR